MGLMMRVASSLPAEAWQAMFYGSAIIGFLMTVAALQKIRMARRNEELRRRAK